MKKTGKHSSLGSRPLPALGRTTIATTALVVPTHTYVCLLWVFTPADMHSSTTRTYITCYERMKKKLLRLRTTVEERPGTLIQTDGWRWLCWLLCRWLLSCTMVTDTRYTTALQQVLSYKNRMRNMRVHVPTTYPTDHRHPAADTLGVRTSIYRWTAWAPY